MAEHDAGERQASLLERLAAQILAVEEKQVESVENRARRIPAVEVGLQLAEGRATLGVEDDRLAVKDG